MIKTKVPIQLKHLIISMLERDSVKRPSIKESIEILEKIKLIL